MKRLLQILAFCAALGALIGAALWVAIWTPGTGVAPSSADIVDLFAIGDESTTTTFQRTLDQLGHETPRAFDLNGNTVYFSTNFIDRSPIEVLKRYQDEFVYQGLNEASYTTIAEARSAAGQKDMLTGGVVPVEISPGYVSMGGGVTDNDARDEADLAQLAVDMAKGERDKKFRAFRHIEAFREEGARFTTVVATWSDETFDYRKMSRQGGANAEGLDLSVDPDIPACPGCTRLQRFEDLDPKQGHVDHIFIGPASVQKTLAFYDRVLPQRGWTLDPSSAVLERVRKFGLSLPDAHTRQYLRGAQTLTLTSYVGPDSDTLVHLTLSGR